MRQSQALTWPQLLMAANAPMMTRSSMVEGKLDAGILPTGQVTGLIDELPTVEDLIESIVHDASRVLDRLSSGGAQAKEKTDVE